MSSIYKRMIILALLIVLFVPAAQAQDEQEERLKNLPPFKDTSKRFEVYGAYILQSDSLNLAHIEGGEESLNVQDNMRNTIELAFAYYFDRRKTIGIEATFGFTFAEALTQDFAGLDDPDNPVIYPIEKIDHKVFSYGANILYNFGYLDIVPFVYIGAGVDTFKPDDDSVYPLDDTYNNIRAGLGLKYFITEWAGARMHVEDRYYMFDDDRVGGNSNQFRLSIGGFLSF